MNKGGAYKILMNHNIIDTNGVGGMKKKVPLFKICLSWVTLCRHYPE